MQSDTSTRIFITGATGFVGRQVLLELKKQDVEVIVSSRAHIGEVQMEELGINKVVTEPDIFTKDKLWWRKILVDVDILIHLAWYTEHASYMDAQDNLRCLQGSLELARGAIDAGISKFVGIGTCIECALDKGPLDRNSEINPKTIYADMKAALFLALKDLLPSHNIDFAWCRLFYLFGEGENPNKLHSYVRNRLEAGQLAYLTGGHQVRDFLDVRVAGQQLAQVALQNNLSGIIHICSGEPVTIRHISQTIARELGKESLLRFNSKDDSLKDAPSIVGVPSLTLNQKT